MSVPTYCTEKMYPSCIIWSDSKFLGMCIKQAVCPRFTDKNEFNKAQALLLNPTAQFLKSIQNGDIETPTKPPEPLPFHVRRFLETFLGRSPCAKADMIDFAKLPAKVIECLPDQANALIAVGLLSKKDVISEHDLAKLLDSGKWDKMSKWLQFDVFFKQLSCVQMTEIEARIQRENEQTDFSKWGIKPIVQIRSDFLKKKSQEMIKK